MCSEKQYPGLKRSKETWRCDSSPWYDSSIEKPSDFTHVHGFKLQTCLMETLGGCTLSLTSGTEHGCCILVWSKGVGCSSSIFLCRLVEFEEAGLFM